MKRFFFYLISFIVVSLTLLLILLHLKPVQTLISKQLVSILSNALDREVTLGKLSFSLRGKIVIEHFSISNDHREFPGNWIEVKKATLSLDMRSLFKGDFHIFKTVLEEPKFTLFLNEFEEDNLPKPKNPSPSVPHVSKDVDKIQADISKFFLQFFASFVQLRHGKFYLRYDPEDLTIDVSDVNLTAIGNILARNYDLTLYINGITFSLAEIMHFTARIEGKVIGDARGVTGDYFHVIVNDGKIAVLAHSVTLRDFPAPKLEVCALVKADMDEIEKIFGFESPVSVSPVIEVRAEGPAENLSGELQLLAEDMEIDALRFPKVEIIGTYKEEQFDFSQVLVNYGEGQVIGKSQLCFSRKTPGITATAKVIGVDLGDILRSYDVDLLTAALKLSGEATFELPDFDAERMSITGEIREATKPETADPLPGFSLLAPFHIDLTKIESPSVMCELPGIAVEAQNLTLDFDLNVKSTIEAHCTSPTQSLKILKKVTNVLDSVTQLPIITADVMTQATVSGNLQEPTIEGRVGIAGFTYDTFVFDTLNSGFAINNTTLRINSALITAGKSELQCNGWVEWSILDVFSVFNRKTKLVRALFQSLPGGEFDIAVSNYPLSKLGPVLETDTLSGQLQLHCAYSGKNAHPELTLTSEITQFVYEGFSIDSFSLKSKLNQDGIAVSECAAQLGAGVLSLSGKVLTDDSLSFKAMVQNIHIEKLIPGEKNADPFPIQGLVSGNGALQGSLFKPDISLKLETQKLQYAAKRLPSVTVTAQASVPDTFDLAVTLSDAALAARITGTNWNTLPLNGEIKINHLDIGPYLATFADIAPKLITSDISGNVAFQLPLTNITQTTAEAYLHPLLLNIGGKMMVFEKPLQARYSDKLVTLMETTVHGDRVNLSISGTLGTTGRTDFSVDGTVDAALLGDLTHEISQVGGVIRVGLAIKGNIGDPLLSGEVAIEEFSLRYPFLSKTVKDMHALLTVDGQIVKLEYVVGMLDDGFFQGSGIIGLKKFMPDYVQLNVKGTDLALAYPKGLQTDFDASIDLVGAFTAPTLSGEVNIQKALYNERIDYKSIIVEESKAVLTLRTRKVEGKSEALSWAPKLNVHVLAPDDVFVKNNLAQLELKTDITVTGDINKPLLFGRVEVIDGTLIYEDRLFTVKSASVDFIDTKEINPLFDIQASAIIDAYELYLSATGKLYGNFNIELSSDPPLSDIDLWALLALGKTTEDISRHGSGYTATQATSILTGRIQDEIEKRIKLIGGFDEFQITPIISDSGENAAARFTVKKNIGDRLTVTYSSEMTSSGQQLMQVEYRVSDRLLLTGQRTEKGSLGGNLVFRFEFP